MEEDVYNESAHCDFSPSCFCWVCTSPDFPNNTEEDKEIKDVE